MEVFGQTDVGCLRVVNQDAFAARVFPNDLAMAVVCDGMGGAKSGEIASEIALESVTSDMADALSSDRLPIDVEDVVAAAVAKAGAAVVKRAAADPECEGMGTTLVAAVVLLGSDAIIANVGDSRGYHISEGSILRVTRDHSVVEDMVARGEITFEQARHHPSRNLITRVLGSPNGDKADVFPLNVTRGDYLLLCSDGLSNILSSDEILELTLGGERPEDSCEKLISMALERGAPDNVTVAIIKI